MSEPHHLFPHGDLEPITGGLWQVTGSQSFPLARKMTVVRLADGTLLLHSAVAMNDSGMAALEALGQPSVMVVPHPFHTLDAAFYARRYPGLRIIADADARDRLSGRVEVSAPPDALAEHGVAAVVPTGMRYNEVVLNVPVEGGRALVFTDLMGHKPVGLMMRLLGAPGGTGVPRIVKFRQVTDKRALGRSLAALAETPEVTTVVSAHGEPFTEQTAELLRFAASRV